MSPVRASTPSAVVWASPTASLTRPVQQNSSSSSSGAAVRTRSMSWASPSPSSTTAAAGAHSSPHDAIAAAAAAHLLDTQGLGLLLPPPPPLHAASSSSTSISRAKERVVDQPPPPSPPPARWAPQQQQRQGGATFASQSTPTPTLGGPFASTLPPNSTTTAKSSLQTTKTATTNFTEKSIMTSSSSPAPAPAAAGVRGPALTPSKSASYRKQKDSTSWVSPQGIWIEIPSTTSMTMAGMVSYAAETEVGGNSRSSINATSNGTSPAVPPTPPLATTTTTTTTLQPLPPPSSSSSSLILDDQASQGGWLRSLQAFMLGTTIPEEEVEIDDEEVKALGSVGRIKLVVQWLPVASSSSSSSSAMNEMSILEHSPTEDDVSLNDKLNQSSKSAAAFDENKNDSMMNKRGQKTRSLSRKSSDAATALALPGVTPSPRPMQFPTAAAATPPTQSGILAMRIAYTKLDVGSSPSNPILALSIASNSAAALSSMSTVAAATAAAVAPQNRLVCMEYQAGGRPGLLHWGRVFHLPVFDASNSRAVLELGDASSSLKLSSYGAELYALDASIDFESDVTVEAGASIPLKDVLAKGVVRGQWRLREARGPRSSSAGGGGGGGVGGGTAQDDHEQLDVGRVVLVMAWFPLEGGARRR